ncbi:adhesion G-protein coupled receptor G2 [Sphaeramia orbicularis]|uniref:adhesion G-protein coupled receptor G2 n=1 Tax=Sphaeramia orbicularis TaxID=375764 RepID=UPI00117C057F|nr:adhesion G-protein coupled receptor G2 [Sphaeramia orbicularis]
MYNATTTKRFTPTTNDTTVYNATTAETFTPTPNKTLEYNVTTTATFTPNPSRNTSSEAFTAYNKTTPTPNRTTVNNVTSANTLIDSLNHTTIYNTTTTITPPPNATTVESRHLHNSSVTTSNTTVATNYTTVSTFTPSPNHTMGYNVTAGILNDTTVYNVTTADNNRLLNSSVTPGSLNSTLTPSPDYTVSYSTTTEANNYITAHNKNITTATTTNMETRQTTDTPNSFTSAAAGKINETIYSVTTTKNFTLNSVTSVDANTTEPTSAPMNNNFTANYTTVSVVRNMTTTTESNTTSTSPTTNLNASADGLGLIPGFNLTTSVPEGSSATSATTYSHKHTTASATTNISTMHNLPPAQEDTTTTTTTTTTTAAAATTVKTTTPTSTATSKPGTGLTTTTAEKTTESQEEKDEDANNLLNQTQNVSQLNSSQVGQLVGQLEKLLDGPTVSRTVGKKAINIISNLMEGSSEALSASANRLIHIVDNLGVKLVVAGESEILSSNSLALAVRTVDANNFPSSSLNIFGTDNIQLGGLGRSRTSEAPLGSVFLPSSLIEGLSPEDQRQASRVQFTFYSKSTLFQDSTLNNQTLVSPVLGSSVANLSIHNLRENIKFAIRNGQPVNSTFKASCVFWDFTLNGGRGGWSSDGCFVVNATSEQTYCSCNHLTSFAILLDLSREGISDRQQAQILTFITYIGCGVSAVFLAITLLTYLSFEKLLRDIPAKILVQLCMSLLFLNLVFLMDGWLALYQATGLCISTAFFLHYFLLTSFTWAGLEALHMYLSIVRVFTPYLSRYMLKFSLMGWGIPLIIVVIIIAVDKDNYGLVTYGKYTDGTTDDFCWLRNDIAFYVGVVAYFILIFALCLLVFIVVMVQLARIKRQNPQNQSPNRGVMTDLRSIAGLIILLGLTWGFALFAWGPLYMPFVYLFSIFNSLQGFFVFVFHCAVKENVRRQWRTYLCCGKLRLAENSEWSRTATQNKSLSVPMATTSAPHLTSRSSSVISDATNSSGSVLADSGVSDGSNSDVVLNEIHRRNMSLRAEL